ncbi:hypothetical protein GPECTOR_2g1373 [Gonium pectorale]|uniref:Extradiol ring-cleavage dioxygenase class III enzyme subunit B domain-containing protein n=1 Tax=Gonium pectorale TaxID=33097 RepID=A0A150H1H3_GONPE|nr:hypothetical protein GPECTOR_2g1373 [Gonium pectorale]|eukprot:KXZ55822.1 hypothetical protein GPECTOR_2g1373 [Gonium pectorale]
MLLCRKSMAYVVGGAVMPHGALVVDPRNFNGSENATDAAYALHYASIEAGRFLQSLEPEVLLLVTPHGLALQEPFLLYNNPAAAGSVSVDDWVPCSFPPCNYNATVRLDVHLTKHLESGLAGSGASVISLSGFGPPAEGTLPLPLAWAEVIPLYFIGRAYEPAPAQHGRGVQGAPPAESLDLGQRLRQGVDTARRLMSSAAARQRDVERELRQRKSRRSLAQHGRGATSSASAASAASISAAAGTVGAAAAAISPNATMPRVVVLSVPSRRYEHSVQMIPELLALGKALFTQLDSLDERIAVVVSGDLAHTWDPAGPYGYSDHAAVFDRAVTQWAHDLDRSALLKTAAKSVGEAKSCGFPGLVLLQGLMDSIKPDDMHSVLLEYGHPSYYGMMCAVFDFQGDA